MIVATQIPRVVADDVVQQLWSGVLDREDFLQKLRAHGATKIESIKAIRDLAHLSLGEAKEAVHFSPTWDDRRASDDAFHDTAVHALQEWQHEDDPSPERLAS